GAVSVAVLVALTVVPALLGFWPDAVLAHKTRRAREAGTRDGAAGGRANLGTRWARFVLRRPVAVLVLGVVGLGALALPVASLQLGMPGDEAKSTATTERRAYDALAEGFGPGFNGPLTIVVDARGAADPHAAVRTISDRIDATDGIVSVSEADFNDAGDTAVFRATPSTSPTDEKTKDLVETIRRDRPAVQRQASATFEVTGTTALNIDVAAKVQSALVPYLAVVGGLAVVLLLVVFRSVLVPVKAALGFVLSVLAALGVLVLVFQEGHAAGLFGVEQTGPVMSLMPIFMMGIVFGLAMDYEVVLVSRMREAYTHGEDAGQAVVSGFRHSARVVTAAALIMVAVFSGFIGEDGSLIKMLGFGLAAAVLFDAFVVRMAIVPAVLALLGDRAWWLPAWLGRVLPRVDVEGAALGARDHARSGRADPDPDGSVEARV
ncbi:MAG: MMPL family transporter, partial [Streptomycetaceae bacterium]|nr:MMPL family transporter [Streptomycetaceae bacterium]